MQSCSNDFEFITPSGMAGAYASGAKDGIVFLGNRRESKKMEQKIEEKKVRLSEKT